MHCCSDTEASHRLKLQNQNYKISHLILSHHEKLKPSPLCPPTPHPILCYCCSNILSVPCLSDLTESHSAIL